ncbi:MAG: hypothetical protein J5I93_09780 [Pirellulaceae bacterium]|nr:hypothetical protein [Pirellulaceae bacterium]
MPSSTRNRTRFHVLGSVLAAALLGDLLIGTVVSSRDEAVAGLVLGLMFCQATLLAVWTALGPVRLFVRAATGLVLTLLLMAAIFFMAKRSTNPVEAWAISGSLGAQWLAVQVPLWLLRFPFGWSIVDTRRWGHLPQRGENQFGIAQLMAWTLLVALALGIARLVVPDGFNLGSARANQTAVTILLLLLAFNSLLAWPLVWATLAARDLVLWLLLAAICGIALTWGENWAFQRLGPGSDLELFLWLNGCQVVLVGSALLLVRACGFRLQRSVRVNDL